MENKRMYFENCGKKHTDQTLELAAARARELGIEELVFASTTGETAYRAMEICKDLSLIMVSCHCGVKTPFESLLAQDVREDLTEKGVKIVTASHALSGVERAVARKHSGIYPALLIADTLRLFGQGTKVAVELALMAADSGMLSGEDIVAVGGSGTGADSALVLKPASQPDLFDLKIREIVCKPRQF